MQRDVFQAVADPTRREIIDLLAGQYLSVSEIADKFTISRPAISRHLKILDECGMLTIKEEGRKRLCKTDVRKLKELDDWVNRYRVFWNNKLDALEASLNKKETE